ncbi:hypothetical protein BC833DRAFT_63936 [Globomyces pollinis-pini]|nr:hypothetical protein BC833DRAFT_63936 [Globomyces pollinis-pini]
MGAGQSSTEVPKQTVNRTQHSPVPPPTKLVKGTSPGIVPETYQTKRESSNSSNLGQYTHTSKVHSKSSNTIPTTNAKPITKSKSISELLANNHFDTLYPSNEKNPENYHSSTLVSSTAKEIMVESKSEQNAFSKTETDISKKMTLKSKTKRDKHLEDSMDEMASQAFVPRNFDPQKFKMANVNGDESLKYPTLVTSKPLEQQKVPNFMAPSLLDEMDESLMDSILASV